MQQHKTFPYEYTILRHRHLYDVMDDKNFLIDQLRMCKEFDPHYVLHSYRLIPVNSYDSTAVKIKQRNRNLNHFTEI